MIFNCIQETVQDQVLASRLGFSFACIMISFSKCYHQQLEDFHSVFLIVLRIKPYSFLQKQNKTK